MRRLLAATLAVTLFCGTVVSLIEFSMDRKNFEEDIHQDLLTLGIIFEPSIAQSLWTYDDVQLESQLRAIAAMQSVSSVSLRPESGVTVQYGSSNGAGSSISHSIQLVYSDGLSETVLGTLTLSKDISTTRSALLEAAFELFTINLATALVIAAMVAIVYQTNVTRRLLATSGALSKINNEGIKRLAREGENFPVSKALLHKSGAERSSPFPGRTYPTATVTGMPSAV